MKPVLMNESIAKLSSQPPSRRGAMASSLKLSVVTTLRFRSSPSLAAFWRLGGSFAIISTLMICGLSLGSVAAEVKPILHASFDKDFRAVAGNDVVDGKHSMQITMESLSMLLHPGVKGKASKIGVQEVNGQLEGALIHYPGKYINPKAGTIAFWLKPLNWDFKDRNYHLFIDAYGPKSKLVIYKYGDVNDLYFLFGTEGKSRVIAEAPAKDWKREVFHHVVATWDNENIRLYLDGILQNTQKIHDHCRPSQFSTFAVGPRSVDAWVRQIGESLIDDLQIYDLPLTGVQVEKLYNSYGLNKLDKSKIHVKIFMMRMMISPDQKVLNFKFNMSRTTQKSTGFPVEMKVIFNKKEVLNTILNSDSTDYHYAFNLADLAEGDYHIQLHPVREKPQDVIENNEFLFTVGDAEPVIDHSVPAPWDPVELKNQKDQQLLIAKMQKTVFGEKVFPVQLYSQEIPMLRGDIDLFCDGQRFNDFSSRKLVEKHPDLQVVESRGENSRFELESRCRFEFDGMMWFEVTLTPKGPQTVMNAKIEIPLRPEVSRLYNCFVKDYFTFRGPQAGVLTHSIKRNHYKSAELPVLWMGNEDRGLYYFSQEQRGRRLKNRDETIRLDPGDNGALFTINLIDYATLLDKPVTWKFGLQVTPVRPFVRNRVFWRPEKNLGMWFPWTKIHNVPDARFKCDNYHERRLSWSKNGSIPLLHYFAGFSMSPEHPGYPQHAYDWSLTPPAVGTEVSPNNRQWSYVFICPNSVSYRNTYIRNIDKCIRELSIPYINFDNSWSQFCSNERHGCGWRDEHGKLYPSANILGSRELAKGIYRVARKQYPSGLITRHISQIPEPPLIAFADCIRDGECFMLNVGTDDNYYKVFSPDFFRASFMGRLLGLPSIYIPQFGRSYTMHFPEKLQAFQDGTMPNKEKNLRHFVGYFLAHDSGLWPHWGVKLDKVWSIFDHAGIGDNSPFYGYWQNDNPVRKVTPQSERVMVSSYQIPTGFLTVIMNDTDNEAAVELSFAAVGADSAWKLTDAESEGKISDYTISVPARDYKMVRIEK